MDIYQWPLKKVCEKLGMSGRSVRRFVEEIKANPRYERAWITSNDCGDTLYNVLVLTDFLHYRAALKDKNLSRMIPPYDPEEVKWQLGESEYSFDAQREYKDKEPVDKDMIRKMMKEILLEGIGA